MRGGLSAMQRAAHETLLSVSATKEVPPVCRHAGLVHFGSNLSKAHARVTSPVLDEFMRVPVSLRDGRNLQLNLVNEEVSWGCRLQQSGGPA